MDYTAEAMQKTLDIAHPELHEVEDIHGVKTIFSTKPLHQVEAKAPAQADCVKVHTLAGFADLVRAKLEDQNFPENYLIHIEDETTVSLISRHSDEYGRRLALIEAEPVDFDQFRFGQWHPQETFAIELASKFAETADKSYVLNLASTLTNEATASVEDDGFTQRATVKAGLSLKAKADIKPRVLLAPYRTFPELEQPASEFVFRARTGSGEGPALMLVAADGGRWKIDAIAKIRAAVEAFELGIPIIA